LKFFDLFASRGSLLPDDHGALVSHRPLGYII
jgi:hypothetical protein